jgi:hydrogenase nickel incorporation protein HypA/HybF
MHEIKFVVEILKNLEELKAANNFTAVKSVEILIGEFSGIEERALVASFQMATHNSIWRDTELKCVIDPLKITCLECGKVSKVIDFEFICSYCKSREVKEVGGKGIFIQSIEAFSI